MGKMAMQMAGIKIGERKRMIEILGMGAPSSF